MVHFFGLEISLQPSIFPVLRAMQLTLLIPELLWPEPDDNETFAGLDLPALTTLLGRSRLTRQPATSFDATLADAFGIASPVPYAALRLLGEGIDPAGHGWACADPVHLRLHQERLLLADGSTLSIEMTEATALADELNRHFADLGEFRVTAPERWYLRLASDAHFDVPPLSEMTGRRLQQQLPEEKPTAWLRKLLNEAQMLMHLHPTNDARTEAGRMTINSLWLWGPGRLPEQLAAPFDLVCSDDPLALGMARGAGVATQAPPNGFATLPTGSRHALVVLTELLRAVQYEDVDAWRERMHALERDWFAPLLGAVRRGQVTLDLRASTIYGRLCWEATRSDAWKLWKRPQPLQDVARQLSAGAAA